MQICRIYGFAAAGKQSMQGVAKERSGNQNFIENDF